MSGIPGLARRSRRLAHSAGALLAGLLQLASLQSALSRPLDEVLESKVLRVVVYDDNAPFSFVEAGEAKGIDVEIGKALAAKLGVAADIIVRMAGEKVDDDLRANIWKGPLTGGALGDVMLHVPVDREIAARNTLAVISNGYYRERIALAVDPKLAGENPTLELFKSERIATQVGSAAHYFLMFTLDGALRNTIQPFLKLEGAVDCYTSGRCRGIMAPRSQIEGALKARGASAQLVEPPMPGIILSQWIVGTAVRENSRDLGYAIGNALAGLRETGELQAIFTRHGVSYVPPPTR